MSKLLNVNCALRGKLDNSRVHMNQSYVLITAHSVGSQEPIDYNLSNYSSCFKHDGQSFFFNVCITREVAQQFLKVT